MKLKISYFIIIPFRIHLKIISIISAFPLFKFSYRISTESETTFESNYEIMKKFFGLLLMLAVSVSYSQAQKLSAAKVPIAVKNAFLKSHPSITKIEYEMEKANYEANFDMNGKETSEVYSKTGSLLETEIGIKVSELPAPITAYIKNKLNSKITEAAKITKSTGEVIYEAEVKGKDMLFTANGVPVKN